MYAMVTVLSVRASTCVSCSSVLKRRKTSHTANNSRQFMCYCSRGPVQSLTAAYLLHMAPKPMAEASVYITTCLDNLPSKDSCPKKSNFWPRAEGLMAGRVDWDPECAASPCPSLDSVMKPMLKRSHMKQTEQRDSRCGCHMPQEPLKLFNWNHPLVLERLQAVQHRTQSGETVCVKGESRKESMCTSCRSGWTGPIQNAQV